MMNDEKQAMRVGAAKTAPHTYIYGNLPLRSFSVVKDVNVS
jgi:hypothetical protein